MVKGLLDRGKKIFVSPQSSVLSAATIIMFMIIASRILGLVRQRVLAFYFVPDELSLFFAAFRLPDLIFEVLVFGTFSAAFIPVFTKTLKEGEKKAWEVAGKIVNIGFLLFVFAALLFGIFANAIYGFITPGFTQEDVARIANLARILFAAQGLFVVSYVLTGVLESLRRFLIPALAPLFYNLGIIFGTIFLTPKFGLTGPAIGVVLGASAHLLVQLPLALKLGFRFIPSLKPTEEVKEVGKLSLPRLIDLSFEEIQKTVELSLASILSTASYTYITLASTLQLFPVSLFGTSLAKAALPTLSRQTARLKEFKKTLFTTLYQIVFLASPVAAALIVLRIPFIRLIYGTDIFDWEATVQTSMVLSAFAIGVVFQASSAILERAFYAMHDTKTPVTVSVVILTLVVIGDFILIKGLSFPVWALAASFSGGLILQASALYYLINKKIGGGKMFKDLVPIFKSAFSAIVSGSAMYFLLKIFDKSVWVKRLSFLGKIDGVSRTIPFERFVLDTRYTVNLIVLTVFVLLVGMGSYLILSILLGSKEPWYFVHLIKKILFKRKLEPIPVKGMETVTPGPSDISET
jgi:putative peptidoglycan lipid II flippase